MSAGTIALFDPSLWTNTGEPSINLGDLIIYESVDRELKALFPNEQVSRFSSHKVPAPELLREAQKASLLFFGGTNALSSDIQKYHQWKIDIPARWKWLFDFPVRNMILLGVGWWQYQADPTPYTSAFYRRALSHKWLHSVRDGYTEQKLRTMGFSNVVNTSCPTLWQLHGHDVSERRNKNPHCLLTLTDYMKNREADNSIIRLIAASYPGRIFFFPQGTLDVDYISTLESYIEAKERITIVDRTFADYVSCLENNAVDYIGTRLHAGIKALQHNRNALILAVDNRAAEISRDVGLPVVDRTDFEKINAWINGVRLFNAIHLPVTAIEQWKTQFRKVPH